jgi:hypothetical protein
MQFINKKAIKLLFLVSSLIVGLFFKLSFGFGSYNYFFSGINFFAPLLGIIFNFPGIICFGIVFLILKQFFLGAMFTFGIPTLVGSVCFAVLNRKYEKVFFYDVLDFVLRVVLPLSLIIIFILHPAGNKAFVYSFYWFIPIIFYLLQRLGFYSSVFSAALSATFITHAIGSIIWLYTLNLTSQQWIGLIPIVAVERLTFAFGITLSSVFLNKFCNVDKNFYYKRSLYLN